MRLAAIDVGTNTVRLLVADVDGASMTTVDRGREITRLGQGLDASGHFHPDAVKRTTDAIISFAGRAREASSDHVRLAGTSAVRDASDRDAFLDAVHAATGLDFEILSGSDEGRITYLGATKDLGRGRYVVCDIGGGSTELSTRDEAVSLDIGSVRLTERAPSDPVAVIDELLDTVVLDLSGTLVGVAGTITTVAAVILGLTSYDADVVHRSVITRQQVASTSERLLSMSVDDIVALGTVERGRADVIGMGSLILRRVMERFGYEEAIVSERDILDGLVWDLAETLA